MTWRIILQLDAETGDWAAWVPELPGCASAGSTQAEAVANMREAIELYLRRDPIALPPGAVVVEVAA
jgi:predicted RNase H-like HicB family nuclease